MKVDLCQSCKWYNRWSEPRPYGSTTANEYFEECEVEAEEFYPDDARQTGVVSECSKYEHVEEPDYE